MKQTSINDRDFVKKQYKDDKGLLIRKKLHERYSFNKLGFSNWLFEILDLPSKGKILELGSGNGDFWRKHSHKLSEATSLTLSDFSEGMVDKIRRNLEDIQVEVDQIDIQAIPYEDELFDIVIANAMLYHVPDLDLALKEVHRVLKPNGVFYASTFGENGLSAYISKSLNNVGLEVAEKINQAFTLQNGHQRLTNHFNHVKRLDYQDKLIITDVQDMVDYIFSMTSMNGLSIEDYDKVYDYFNEVMKAEGVIEIPKEYGSFVARK